MNNTFKMQRSLLYGFVAAVIYGLIAVFSHWHHPLPVMVKASLSHGAFCFIMTCISTAMMEFFFARPKKPLFKYLIGGGVPGLINLSLLLSTHYLMATPEIFKTVVPTILTSLPYYLLFPLKLMHEWQQTKNPLAYREDPNWDREWPLHPFSPPYQLKDFLKCLGHNVFYPSKEHQELSSYIPQTCVFNSILSLIHI